MNLRRASLVVLAAVAAVAATLTLGLAPAGADGLGFSDPEGDDAGGLDIVSASLDNGDDAIVAEVGVVRTRAGHVLVSIDRRGGPGRTIVATQRRDGSHRKYLVRGSFLDQVDHTKVRCRGLRVTWNDADDVVRLRMPAGCMDDGDYRRVRFSVLTERPGGSDSDFAPDGNGNDLAVSDWIGRG